MILGDLEAVFVLLLWWFWIFCDCSWFGCLLVCFCYYSCVLYWLLDVVLRLGFPCWILLPLRCSFVVFVLVWVIVCCDSDLVCVVAHVVLWD